LQKAVIHLFGEYSTLTHFHDFEFTSGNSNPKMH
jgi:hypothetical protein